MQKQHGLPAEEAILSPERHFRARVLVDWNLNGTFDHELSDVSAFVEDISTDRALEGSAPAEILLVEGFSAAQMVVKLGGEYNGQSLSNLFSPYNPKSPFFKRISVSAEIKYSLIVESVYGGFEYPQFVGNIRTISPDRASSNVEITALDRAEKLAKPVIFPPFAMDEFWANCKGRRKSQQTDTSWIVDHCLRQCDTSPTPWRHTYRSEMGVSEGGYEGTQLWVSGTGSHLPSIGWSTRTSVTQYPPVEALGIEMYSKNGQVHPSSPDVTEKPYVFNSTTSTAGDHRYWVSDRDQINPSRVHLFSFTLHDDAVNGTWWRSNTPVQVGYFYIGGDYAVRILVGNGNMWTQRERTNSTGGVISGQTVTSSTVAVPAGSSVRCYVVWDLTVGSGSRYYLKAGSNQVGWTTTGAGLATNISETNVLRGFCTLYHGAAYSDFCYAIRDTIGLTPDQALLNAGRPAAYAAVLDDGLQQLTYIPVKRGESAWEIIKEVAGSEQASVFWDEAGVFRFWNYGRIATLQNDVVRTFTLDDLSGLSITNTLDSVRNTWSIESTKCSSVYGIMYNSANADDFFTPNNTELWVRINLDGVVAPDPSRLTRFSSGTPAGLPQFLDTTLHGYVIEFEVDDEFVELDDETSLDVYCRCYYDNQGFLVVRVTNNTGYDIRLSKLHIGGNIIKKYDPVVWTLSDPDSVGLYGPRNYKLDGPWIQEGYSEDRIRATLMSRTLTPIPTTDAITVAGDPRIQLGDTVTLTDPDGFGVDLKVQIVGIGRDFSLDGGLTDTLTVQLVSTDEYVPPVEPEAPPVRRRNLCPNPALKYNAADYFGPDGSSRVTGLTGMVRPAGYNQGGKGLWVGPRGDVRAGDTYTFSAFLKGVSGATSGRCYIDWYTRGGHYLASTRSTSWSVLNGQVIRVDSGAQKAPNRAAEALLVISQNDARITATGLLYEESDTVGTYFDGDTPGAVWTGTDGNSESVYG
jgi:hypothetical protein